MEIHAVDAASFGSAVIWPSSDAYKAARPLLAELVSSRQDVIDSITVPAIVDAITADQLRLHVDSSFTIKLNSTYPDSMRCIVIGVLDSIPTINNRIAPNSGSSAIGGVLVDYQTYTKAFAREAKQNKNTLSAIITPTINHVWLHTKDDATSVTGIRSALNSSKFHLSSLVDRRLLLTTLQSDPLYLILSSILTLGTATALLLAVIGNLLASWLRAYTRIANFATLRAIGTTGRQVISILTWEQAIIYVTSFLLGCSFGIFLAFSMIPVLTFTDVNSNLSDSQLFALQSALATQLVIPTTLPLVLLAIVVIFALALLLMLRVISQPALSQILRLNED
jgi:ABC-type antimicrobial peptide transport system permease subunit